MILFITNNVIDPYIKATNWGFNLFDFYNTNDENNKIYFIGDSLTAYGVDPVTVEKTLQTNNLSFKVYNIAYPNDMPVSRIVELKSIAKSNPKICVIGVPYYWLNDNGEDNLRNVGDYRMVRSLLASDKFELDPYTKSMFNKSRQELIQMDAIHLIFYKRQFIIPGIRLILFNFGFGGYDPVKEYFNQSEMRPWAVFNEGMLNFRDQFDPGNHTQPAFDAQCPYIMIDDNENRRALKHIIEYLMLNEIHVIIVNMPINPYYISNCDDDHLKPLEDFAISTKCPYYDCESLCSTNQFMDTGHANYAGRQNISRKMGDILLKEARNVSQ